MVKWARPLEFDTPTTTQKHSSVLGSGKQNKDSQRQIQPLSQMNECAQILF